MEFFVTIIGIAVFVLYFRQRGTRKRIALLEERQEKLAKNMWDLHNRWKSRPWEKTAKGPMPVAEPIELPVTPPPTVVTTSPPPSEEPVTPPIVQTPPKEEIPIPVYQDSRIPEPEKVLSEAIPLVEEPSQPREPEPESANSILWKKLEKQFMENWTGILGSAIMVVGVGFLGIYAALKLAEVYRFMMILGFSIAVGVGSYFQIQRPKWQKLGYWLRSSAGAIFLFACLGAGGIQGLIFIDNPLIALGVLILGIMVNLYLGYAGKEQIFGALHVVLSLLALALAPQSLMTLTVAALVTVYGVALTLQHKWELHLLTSITGFFIFQLYWLKMVPEVELTQTTHFWGIGLSLLVGIPAALSAYRKAYTSEKVEILPLVVHLLNWIFLGASLYMHALGSPWKTVFILLGAAGIFITSRRARKLGIEWLNTADTLISQLVAMIGIISLVAWEMSELAIVSILFIEIMIFVVVMMAEKQNLLHRIGVFMLHLSALFLFGIAFFDFDVNGSGFRTAGPWWLFGTLVAAMAFHLYTLMNRSDSFDPVDFPMAVKPLMKQSLSGLAVLSAAWLTLLYLHFATVSWGGWLMLALAGSLWMVREKIKSNGLMIGLLAFIVFWMAHVAITLTLDPLATFGTKFMLTGPVLVMLALTLVWNQFPMTGKPARMPGIYLFSLQAGFMVYLFLSPVSELVPGVVWLLCSMIALETALFMRKKYGEGITDAGGPDRYWLHVGYALIAVFMGAHVLVHLQSEAYFWIFKIRLLIELLAIGVFAYWAWQKVPEGKPVYKTWEVLHPLFLELTVIFGVFTVAMETDLYWQPLIWMAAAFGLAELGMIWKERGSRLQLYAIGFFWATAFQVGFIASTHVSPSMAFYDQTWWTSTVAIIMQFGFIIYYFKRMDLAQISLPKVLVFFEPLRKGIQSRPGPWVLYPMILCVAVFLFGSFDRSLLTFLWVLECFLILGLSIILREKQFRYVAMGALMLCIIRLIFFDLGQSGTLTKALVFLGVGILMLLMNSMYNRFKDRFE